MSAATSLDFGAVADEAGGIMTLRVFAPRNAATLMAAAEAGDQLALQGIASIVRDVNEAPKPVPCGCCGRTIGRQDVFRVVIATPNIDRPKRSLICALCPQCCASDTTADAAAVRALHDVYPYARPFVVTHPAGGRA